MPRTEPLKATGVPHWGHVIRIITIHAPITQTARRASANRDWVSAMMNISIKLPITVTIMDI